VRGNPRLFKENSALSRAMESRGDQDRIRFVAADACESGLPTAGADFVWGEDVWCYVTDKPKLISEAARAGPTRWSYSVQ